MTTGFLRAPRNVDAQLRMLQQGKMNIAGSVTLTALATTTTLNNPLIGGESVILFMAKTANAAIAAAALYITARAKGSATINHASAAAADQSFDYVVIG